MIDNLVANALRVTPAGEQIILQAAWTPMAVTSKCDGGPGLSDSDLEVAFRTPAELYSRYQGLRHVGTGVGLALVGRLEAGFGSAAGLRRSRTGGRACLGSVPAGNG